MTIDPAPRPLRLAMIGVAGVLACAPPAAADVLSEMNRFW